MCTCCVEISHKQNMGFSKDDDTMMNHNEHVEKVHRGHFSGSCYEEAGHAQYYACLWGGITYTKDNMEKLLCSNEVVHGGFSLAT